MADEQHDIGEIWATVRGQGTALANLANQVTAGFDKIGETIAVSHEKTDRRISQVEQSTTARFEQVAASSQTSVAARNTQTLTVVGILITAMLGLGGVFTGLVTVGATIYTFTKQPIDQTFTQQSKTLDQLTTDLKAEVEHRRAYVDSKLADYVPKGEVETNVKLFTDVTARNTNRIDEIEKGIIQGIEERKALQRSVQRIDDDVHELRNGVKQDFATRKETDVQFADQQQRTNSVVLGLDSIRKQLGDGSSLSDRFKDVIGQINSLANTVSRFQDNFVVVPSFPKYKQDGAAPPAAPR